MDIEHLLLQGRSKVHIQKMVDFVGNDPKRFQALVQVLLQGSSRAAQQASWVLGYCVEHHPELIKPHLSLVLKNLDRPSLHDAVKRNTVRLLQFIDIPKRYYGQVADFCFAFLQNRKEAIAIRVFAMSVLANIVRHEPDLKKELLLIIEDELPYASAGFISRARKIQREFKSL